MSTSCRFRVCLLARVFSEVVFLCVDPNEAFSNVRTVFSLTKVETTKIVPYQTRAVFIR